MGEDHTIGNALRYSQFPPLSESTFNDSTPSLIVSDHAKVRLIYSNH